MRKLGSDGFLATVVAPWRRRLLGSCNDGYCMAATVTAAWKAVKKFRIDYDAFGDVVVFDSTYRMNKYNLSFIPFVGAIVGARGCSHCGRRARARSLLDWGIRALRE
ncbi:hypothetical protein GUJ93_ZPchr0006g42218 [Zizania palustris]|uniref:Uncharacterized protein n=1 Tax=Zizania palustris TaxID=103762 RepID=A0A8J5SIY5_ZIZPA|nr:hypothetical protein GUJ93_ZPchr0006g42218 [Zizania palustris]